MASEIYFKSSGSGRPIIFIHGFCETHAIWNDWLSLISHTHSTYTIDLPGFGLSPLNRTSFTIDDIASDVIEWLKDHSLKSPILVGHSLGGYVALAMVAANPTLFSGLVLFHSTAMADTEERKQNRLKTIEFVRKNGVRTFVDSFVPGLFYDKRNTAIPQVLRIASAAHQETFEGYSYAMKERPDRRAVLKSYKQPTLMLGGEFDTLIDSKSLMDQAKLNAEIQFFNLKKTAHMGFLEAPESSSKLLNSFILRG